MSLTARIEAIQQIRFFRYLVAAGTATLVDVVIYFILFNYVLHHKEASLVVSYLCGTVTNFLISKHYVFQESTLQTSSQMTRFLVVAGLVLLANLWMNDFLVKNLPVYVNLSEKPLSFAARLTSAALIAVVSFVCHKLFSFNVKNAD